MTAHITTFRLPASYELKKDVARNKPRFWKSERLGGLPSASVYVFPDQEKFDSDEVGELCREVVDDWPHLPHSDIIFEVVEPQNGGRSVAVYAIERDATIEGFLFARNGGSAPWSDVLCHASYMPEKLPEAQSPPGADRSHAEIFFNVLDSTLRRAIALLQINTPAREEPVSRLRRGLLAKHGVSGWSYRIAAIDLPKTRPPPQLAQGTHATPRWHIRRGHWRQLQDGRRVFVRECEVGDQTRGGVIKDYRVQLGRAA